MQFGRGYGEDDAQEFGSFVYGANESMQENLDRGEPVIFAAYGVIGAILLLGGGGYLLDRWLGTQPWFLLAGLVVGLCLAFYSLVRAAARTR